METVLAKAWTDHRDTMLTSQHPLQQTSLFHWTILYVNYSILQQTQERSQGSFLSHTQEVNM